MKEFDLHGFFLAASQRIRLLLACILLLAYSQCWADEKTSIRLAVLSIEQPSHIYAQWQSFTDYMSKQLGKPVELVTPRGYNKLKASIENNDIDFFYINSYVFYRLHQDGIAVAVAQVNNLTGKTTSHSQIIVRKNSGINTVDDLKGKSIAFASPMGVGDYLAPRAYLYSAGLQSNKDYQELFTKNLPNSIHGVLLGDYDAATMCAISYELMSHKIKTGELRIIATSDEYPDSVIAARNNLPAGLTMQFRRQLLALDKNPEGKQVLESMRSVKIKSFVEYDENLNIITQKLVDIGHL